MKECRKAVVKCSVIERRGWHRWERGKERKGDDGAKVIK